MSIPNSGPIRFTDINTTRKAAVGALGNVGARSVRTIAGIHAGPIKFSNMRGAYHTQQTFTLYAIPWSTENNNYNGFAIAGGTIPQNGTLSPTVFLGHLIKNIFAVRPISNPTGGHVQLTLNRTALTPLINKVLAITIGGLRIPITVCWDGMYLNGVRYAPKDGNSVYALGTITNAQYNTIVAAILNKTTTVTVEFYAN